MSGTPWEVSGTPWEVSGMSWIMGENGQDMVQDGQKMFKKCQEMVQDGQEMFRKNQDMSDGSRCYIPIFDGLVLILKLFLSLRIRETFMLCMHAKCNLFVNVVDLNKTF